MHLFIIDSVFITIENIDKLEIGPYGDSSAVSPDTEQPPEYN